MVEEIIEINQLRKKSIVMLSDIKESLDKHNVKYWLDFGTLLGRYERDEQCLRTEILTLVHWI